MMAEAKPRKTSAKKNPTRAAKGQGHVSMLTPRVIEPDQPLADVRMEAFCWDVLTMMGAQAFRKNFPECMKWSPARRSKSISERASRLSKALAPRIKYLVQNHARKYAEGAERVLWALRAIAQTDLPDVIDWDSGTLRVEDFALLSPEQRAAIQEIQVERDVWQFDETSEPVEYVKRIKVKMHSKTEALKLLGQHERLWQSTETKAPPLSITINLGPPRAPAPRQLEDEPVDVDAEVSP